MALVTLSSPCLKQHCLMKVLHPQTQLQHPRLPHQTVNFQLIVLLEQMTGKVRSPATREQSEAKAQQLRLFVLPAKVKNAAEGRASDESWARASISAILASSNLSIVTGSGICTTTSQVSKPLPASLILKELKRDWAKTVCSELEVKCWPSRPLCHSSQNCFPWE